jgi:hypothetical protein
LTASQESSFDGNERDTHSIDRHLKIQHSRKERNDPNSHPYTNQPPSTKNETNNQQKSFNKQKKAKNTNQA